MFFLLIFLKDSPSSSFPHLGIVPSLLLKKKKKLRLKLMNRPQAGPAEEGSSRPCPGLLSCRALAACQSTPTWLPSLPWTARPRKELGASSPRPLSLRFSLFVSCLSRLPVFEAGMKRKSPLNVSIPGDVGSEPEHVFNWVFFPFLPL